MTIMQNQFYKTASRFSSMIPIMPTLNTDLPIVNIRKDLYTLDAHSSIENQ